jgi:hypothetical protein
MSASKIMIIRHAEKPTDLGVTPVIEGVAADGSESAEELSVRGWQRSGALVHLFAPRDGHFVDPHLATPGTIFASKADQQHGKSLRPQHTVLELATVLKATPNSGFKEFNTKFVRDDYVNMIKVAGDTDGSVLVAWEHHCIPLIAERIVGATISVPQPWPGDRYDLVWVFDREDSGWGFSQVPQLLLSGDSATPISH